MAVALRAAVACSDSDVDAVAIPEAGATDGVDANGGVAANDEAGSLDPLDGGTSADSSPPPPPSFCNGVVFYASFDNGAAPEFGGGLTRAVGRVDASTGQFGGGLSLIADNGPDGSAVFFDRVDGGAVIYPQAEGSIAFWFRPSGPRPAYQSMVRPLSRINPATAGGLILAQTNGQFGLWRDLGSGPVLIFPVSEVEPFLRGAGFDHYAEAWRARTDAGGSFAVLAINGGTGEVFGDASVDAAGDLAETPDDAGNLMVPFRAQTTKAWPNYPPLASLRLGGARTTAPQGDFDDFAVWDRVLSFAEIEEIYRRGESIGVACKLP
jgi:hypothetical protein